MDNLTLAGNVPNREKFLINLNRLCLTVNKKFPSRTPLDLSQINRMKPAEFIQWLDILEKECTDLPEIQTYISELRHIARPLLTRSATSEHPVAATSRNALSAKLYHSHSEVLKLAERFNMTVVSERQGRDVFYKLASKNGEPESKPDHGEPAQDNPSQIAQEIPEFLEKPAEVKKMEKRFGVKYEPVKQGRDFIGYRLIKKSS